MNLKGSLVVIMKKSISDYSDETLTPSKFAYVIASNKVYEILDPKQIDEIIEKKHAYDILKEYKLIFEFPLSKGLRYGETMQIGRSDAGYIWHVEKVYDVKTHIVDKPSKAYFIAQRAVGWHETMLFQPYLGILEHSYFHSGTVDEYSFKLTSFITKSEVK